VKLGVSKEGARLSRVARDVPHDFQNGRKDPVRSTAEELSLRSVRVGSFDFYHRLPPCAPGGPSGDVALSLGTTSPVSQAVAEAAEGDPLLLGTTALIVKIVKIVIKPFTMTRSWTAKHVAVCISRCEGCPRGRAPAAAVLLEQHSRAEVPSKDQTSPRATMPPESLRIGSGIEAWARADMVSLQDATPTRKIHVGSNGAVILPNPGGLANCSERRAGSTPIVLSPSESACCCSEITSRKTTNTLPGSGDCSQCSGSSCASG
jgi:hypothetical protein